MMHAFWWGLLATSSLVLGGVIACRFALHKRTLGVIMAFGAGSLISAVAYELIYEAVTMAKGSGYPAFGLFVGAFVFFASDLAIERIGARGSKASGATHHSSLVVPMILAIVLDGAPESIVIGLGVYEKGTVSLAMLVAVFISNLPEAIAGTVGMKAGGWNNRAILLLWVLIAFVCALAAVAGYHSFSNVTVKWLSFIQAFAGGAILMMLANTMIPESYEHGKKLAGVFTVLGFAVSVAVVVAEGAF